MRTLRVLAFLLLPLLPAIGAVNLVVHKMAKDLTGAEITALATPGYNSTAGNLIVVWTATYSGAQPVGYITDSAGDTFTPATLNRGTWYGQWFYARNVKGEGFNVVTIHPATTGRATLIYPAMAVMEFSGADKAAPLAAEITGQQGSLPGAWTSNAFDAPAGGVALLGIVTANGGAYTAGGGFKIEDSYLTPNSAKYSFAALDRFFADAQTGVTASVTWTGTLQATGAVAVLKAAGGH
jgi:hypothetical protein